MRHLDASLPWEVTVSSARGTSSQVPLRSDLRARVRVVEPDALERDALLASADVVVLASAGALPAPGTAIAALVARAVPLASRLAGL